MTVRVPDRIRRATARAWASSSDQTPLERPYSDSSAWQESPLLSGEPDFRPATAFPMSASGRTTAADSPPRSRLTRLSCSPAIEAMRRPARVEPVKGDLVDLPVRHETMNSVAGEGRALPGHVAGLVQPRLGNRQFGRGKWQV